MVTVTKDNYPKVFAAFQMIDLDSGVVNRYEPAREEYTIPCDVEDVQVSERALATLTDGEFDRFCVGDEEDILKLAGRSWKLETAHELLSRYFEEWL